MYNDIIYYVAIIIDVPGYDPDYNVIYHQSSHRRAPGDDDGASSFIICLIFLLLLLLFVFKSMLETERIA